MVPLYKWRSKNIHICVGVGKGGGSGWGSTKLYKVKCVLHIYKRVLNIPSYDLNAFLIHTSPFE